jgi:DnaA family protein
MKQLVLDLGADQAHSLASFEVGQNADGAALMHQFATRTSREHFAYLWGPAASARPICCLASAARRNNCARATSRRFRSTEFLYSPEVDLYLLDDCEKLSPAPDRRLRPVQPNPRHGAFMVCTRPGAAGRAAGARRPAHAHGLGPDLPDPRPERR